MTKKMRKAGIEKKTHYMQKHSNKDDRSFPSGNNAKARKQQSNIFRVLTAKWCGILTQGKYFSETKVK